MTNIPGNRTKSKIEVIMRYFVELDSNGEISEDAVVISEKNLPNLMCDPGELVEGFAEVAVKQRVQFEMNVNVKIMNVPTKKKK